MYQFTNTSTIDTNDKQFINYDIIQVKEIFHHNILLVDINLINPLLVYSIVEC